MIFLSLALPVRTTRWVSTLAVILTTLFVIGGGSATYSYVFFAALEHYSLTTTLFPAAVGVACLLLVGILVYRRQVGVAEKA